MFSEYFDILKRHKSTFLEFETQNYYFHLRAQRVLDDEDFISDEKVLNESVSFKILRNAFLNPLLESSSEEDVPSKKMPKNIFIKKYPEVQNVLYYIFSFFH